MEEDWWNKKEGKGHYVSEVEKHGKSVEEDGEVKIERRRADDSQTVKYGI